ncbi:hypothetical protein MKW94_000588 [Papaver nudicaule]|uniref:Uncharacterized protein n=1 Tax=Papaver nudicaule TaxID=74823 RepID=A0AA41V3C7_PAPNU|nr:hypothetical protein [Papaver nudicaule]
MADTEMSNSTDGPVLNLMNKRLRALRKKHNRIVQMEEAVSQGKPLNKEQEEVLRSKTAVVALIDEYEKLRQPLHTAVQEEILFSQAQSNHHHRVSEEAEETQKPNPNNSEEEEHRIEKLLDLVYFASLFDAKSQNDYASIMLTRSHERGCCITYDYVTDDATDLLAERDLDSIVELGSLVISRPTHSGVSHEKAFNNCIQHAKRWIMNSDEPIEPGSDVTYAGLRKRLNKIKASDYYTIAPEMKAPVEVAAAAEKFVPCQIPVESFDPSESENAFQHYQQQDEETTNFQGQETGADQSSPVEVHHEEESEMSNPAGVALVQQQDRIKLDAEAEEQSQRDVESNEETTNQRKSYPNHRGGGYGGRRGGYPNGRGGRPSRGGGGGGYQNGRGQYYEQPGNYYPRNYNTRGGRGSRGGNGGYASNSHGSTAYTSHAQADSPSS